MTVFKYVPHPHIARRARAGPVTVAAQHSRSTAAARFNARLAVGITKVVGSMWCAYAFGLFDLLSLKPAIQGGVQTIVSWVAQTFLQLVLLSIIMVGQDVQAQASDKRAEQTYLDAEAVLHEAQQIQAHLQAQDSVVGKLGDDVAGLATTVRAVVRALPPAEAPPQKTLVKNQAKEAKGG